MHKMSSSSQDCTSCIVKWNFHQKTLFSNFYDFLERNEMVDCQLSSENRFVSCHKIVLAASSNYFKKIFSQHQNVKPTIIYFEDISFLNLCLLLKFIYTGEATMSEDRIERFMDAAKSLQLIGVMDRVENLRKPKKIRPPPKKSSDHLAVDASLPSIPAETTEAFQSEVEIKSLADISECQTDSMVKSLPDGDGNQEEIVSASMGVLPTPTRKRTQTEMLQSSTEKRACLLSTLEACHATPSEISSDHLAVGASLPSVPAETTEVFQSEEEIESLADISECNTDSMEKSLPDGDGNQEEILSASMGLLPTPTHNRTQTEMLQSRTEKRARLLSTLASCHATPTEISSDHLAVGASLPSVPAETTEVFQSEPEIESLADISECQTDSSGSYNNQEEIMPPLNIYASASIGLLSITTRKRIQTEMLQSSTPKNARLLPTLVPCHRCLKLVTPTTLANHEFACYVTNNQI